MSDMDLLPAIVARDEAWSPRCQFWMSFLSIEGWPCGWAQNNHPKVMTFPEPRHDHSFTYDPDLDTSPEADRRRLLVMLGVLP